MTHKSWSQSLHQDWFRKGLGLKFATEDFLIFFQFWDTKLGFTYFLDKVEFRFSKLETGTEPD